MLRKIKFACLVGFGAMAIATSAPAADYKLTTVAEGLDNPWGIAFLPGGVALITERSGNLRVMRNGVLDPNPVQGVPEAFVAGQGGLMDVVAHPGFADNGFIYLSLAHGTFGENATRVVRARFDGTALNDVEPVFTSDTRRDTAAHYGGRMTFLEDGTLLVTLGDGFVYREDAQRLSNHTGTIVRINDDGSVPQDNPFVGRDDARPEIYSYGHRNVQGIVVDAATGRIYEHEHGPLGGDELNLIEKGKNYGWPIISYGLDYTGAKVSPYTEKPGMELPLAYWDPSIAPAGMTIYTGDEFPEWTGDIFVAALVRPGHVERIDMENGKPVRPGKIDRSDAENLFTELNARIRDVRMGSDGRMYLLTDSAEGKVIRVDPAE